MTPEQQARDLLERMGCGRVDWRSARGGEYELHADRPRDMSDEDVVELANLIAERDRLRADLVEYALSVVGHEGTTFEYVLGDGERTRTNPHGLGARIQAVIKAVYPEWEP